MILDFLAKLKQILLFTKFSTNKRVSLFLGIAICLSLFMRWSYDDENALITLENDITNTLLIITIVSFFVNYFSRSIYALISYLMTLPLLFVYYEEKINQEFVLGDIFNFFTIGFWIFIISLLINISIFSNLKRQYTTIFGVLFVGYIFYFGLYGNINKELSIREDMEVRKKINYQQLSDLAHIQKFYYESSDGDTTNRFLHDSKELQKYLMYANFTYIDSSAIDKDSMPEDMASWNKIKDDVLSRKSDVININEEARKIYRSNGGKWKTLTEQEKIAKGYISVNIFQAHDLAFNEQYKRSRKKAYNLDILNLSNIKKSNNTLNSFSNFTDEISVSLSEREYLLTPLKIRDIYNSINKIKTDILSGDTSIYIESLSSNIRLNKDEISKARKELSSNKREKRVMIDSIENTEARIQLYTSNIGTDKIEKAKEKANKKQEKGKELKGRFGKIYEKITRMERSKTSHSSKHSGILMDIDSLQAEIEIREGLIETLAEKSQFLLDLQAMQKQYIKINSNPSINFDTLCNYIINEEIKITTVLKEGQYTLPTLPNEWKRSLIEAELLLENSIQKADLLEINRQYTLDKGKWRRLTKQESEVRGLYVEIKIPVVDTIFNKEYLQKRQENIKSISEDNEYLNQDLSDYLRDIIYIPFAYEGNDIKKEYRFNTRSKKNDEGKHEHYCEISVDYDDVFYGLDEEYKTLQTKKEKETASIGSLIDAYQTDLYANWGEK